MLSPDVQKKIVRMSHQGYSEADICRATGVSRNGVRRMMTIARRHTPIKIRLARLIQIPVTEQSVFGRCPTCGVKCYLPCKSCLTKQYNQLCKHPVEDESYSDSEVIEMLQNLAKENQGSRINMLNLRPADRKRYEKVRRRKEAEMEHASKQTRQLEFA